MSGLLLPEQIRHADHVVFNAKKGSYLTCLWPTFPFLSMIG
jgi:hypothetical protein